MAIERIVDTGIHDDDSDEQIVELTLRAKSLDGNHYAVSIDELSWRPSVYGIVIRDGKNLLSPQHGTGYDLPGGGMEYGESLEQAVIREVKEETGIDVRPINQLATRTQLFVWKPNEKNERKATQSILIYYLCEVLGGTLSVDGFDIDEKNYAELAEWVDLAEIDTIGVASTVDYRELVKVAMQNK